MVTSTTPTTIEQLDRQTEALEHQYTTAKVAFVSAARELLRHCRRFDATANAMAAEGRPHPFRAPLQPSGITERQIAAGIDQE